MCTFLLIDIETSLQRHHKFVQLMQIDIGQNRRDNPTLGRSTICDVITPVLHVSGFQKFVQQLYQPRILDFSVYQPHQNSVVNVVKATLDVALYKPPCTGELLFGLC